MGALLYAAALALQMLRLAPPTATSDNTDLEGLKLSRGGGAARVGSSEERGVSGEVFCPPLLAPCAAPRTHFLDTARGMQRVLRSCLTCLSPPASAVEGLNRKVDSLFDTTDKSTSECIQAFMISIRTSLYSVTLTYR